jgi:hypothetical protein
MARMRNYQPWNGSPGVIATVAADYIRAAQSLGFDATGSTLGGSSPILIPQQLGIEVVPGTLGVIRARQVLAAEAVGNTSGGTFSPLSISGAVAWIDMQDPTAYTESGGTVTALKNKVSSVSWAASASCPFEATGLNGHPCLHPIDLTDSFRSSESAVVSVFDCPDTGAAKPYTIVCAVAPDSITTGNVIFGVGNTAETSASTRVWGHRAGVSQYEYAQTLPAVNGNARSATATVVTGLNRLAWTSAGTTMRMFLANVELALTVSASGTASNPLYTPGVGPNRLALFERPDLVPDGPYVGRFGEIAIYNRELNSTELGQLDAYFAARWS